MPIAISSKSKQIEKAASNIFVVVAIASVVVSACIVAMNLLWNQSQFNARVQDEKEKARDTLLVNIERSEPLIESLRNFENADNIIADQRGKTNTAVILDALPSRYDFPALASSVQNIADVSGVKLSSFGGDDNQAEADQTSTDPVPVPIEFTARVEGNYNQIKKFLSVLERSIRPIHVDNLTLSGTDANLQLEMSATTYYQPGADLTITTKDVE